MVEFPPELTDRFIDYLADDKPALKACGLICSQWYPRSRVHLFLEVQLRAGLKPVHIHDMRDNMEAFFDLVETSPFDVLASIRRLFLLYGTEESLAKAPLVRFAPCSQLTDLDISLLRDTGMFAPLYAQLTVVCPKFPSLSKFSFSSTTFPLHALLGILECVPTIETFWLSGWDICIIEPSAPVPPFPQRLRSLHLDLQDGIELFFEHLLSLPAIPQLQSLEIPSFTGPEACTAIAHYLQHAGTALQSLNITLSRSGKPFLFPVSSIQWFPYPIPESFAKQFLQCCTDLRHLSINFFKFGGEVVPTFLIDLLSAASSNKLLSIKITLLPHEFAAEALDQALKLPPFCNLRSFSLEGGRDRSLFTPEIRARMPLANARGILE
jgi:hypothetical protein